MYCSLLYITPFFIVIFLFTYLLRLFFFFNDPAPTEIYTLSLHDALPISVELRVRDPELPLALRDEEIQPLDQLGDLLAIQLTAELIQARLLRLVLMLAFVVAPLQPPHVRPMG